jgi:hypothetical protein
MMVRGSRWIKPVGVAQLRVPGGGGAAGLFAFWPDFSE